MPPKLLGGPVPDVQGKDRRAVLAEWLTSPDNPFFARSIANRIWAYFFGQGIVEPVDDFRVSNPPSNPELLAELAQAVRRIPLRFSAIGPRHLQFARLPARHPRRRRTWPPSGTSPRPASAACGRRSYWIA